MQTIAVIDYGASNLRSVSKALEYVSDKHSRILVTDKAEQILAADKIVFPGQGAMGQCMSSLIAKGLADVIREGLGSKPFLGICLGLQTLLESSDEDGGVDGLAVIAGRVNRFKSASRDAQDNLLKIPHMGWNRVMQRQRHALWQDIADGERFYFVHSYYVCPASVDDIAASCHYGVDFTAAVARENVFATQFHPEKSQQAGLQLLSNFLQWQP